MYKSIIDRHVPLKVRIITKQGYRNNFSEKLVP